jgi:hypothetical protein
MSFGSCAAAPHSLASISRLFPRACFRYQPFPPGPLGAAEIHLLLQRVPEYTLTLTTQLSDIWHSCLRGTAVRPLNPRTTQEDLYEISAQMKFQPHDVFPHEVLAARVAAVADSLEVLECRGNHIHGRGIPNAVSVGSQWRGDIA